MKKIICILFVCLSINLRWAQGDPVNILPLGNSITYGYPGNEGGYRQELYDLLHEANIDFNFVGTQGNEPLKHEGIIGITSTGILNRLEHLVINYNYDHVLLHIGTNDIPNPNIDVATTKNNVIQIIEKLKEKDPSVVFFLATIIPSLNDNYPLSEIKELNNVLMQLADEQVKQGTNVVIVDHYAAFLIPGGEQPDPDLFNPDMIHPNESGYRVMADTWFQAIRYEMTTLTKGYLREPVGVGRQTTDVTEPNTWRWSENYFGLDKIAYVIELKDECSDVPHIYTGGSATGATAEYLMKFGGEYSQLILRGIADDPGPVIMDIYVDGILMASAQWDDNDNCNDLAYVKIEGLKYDTHAIAVF